MKAELATVRTHPAPLASIVIAGVAASALAIVTVAYLLGWVPARSELPSAPGSMASPGQQLAGTVVDGVALLPGETLVAPADTLAPRAPQRAAESALAPAPPPAPKPATPQYARPAPPEAARPAGTTYAQELPARAAPGKPSYNAPYTSYERSTRNICINCGTVASIASSGGDWEVRVRFEDGSIETMRYPDRPRLRVGEHVHLEDGRLIPE